MLQEWNTDARAVRARDSVANVIYVAKKTEAVCMQLYLCTHHQKCHSRLCYLVTSAHVSPQHTVYSRVLLVCYSEETDDRCEVENFIFNAVDLVDLCVGRCWKSAEECTSFLFAGGHSASIELQACCHDMSKRHCASMIANSP